MNIGIYKPGKKIFFYKNTEDHASWSIEITNFAKLLADNGNVVYILSETDYIDEYTNIIKGNPENIYLDRIFVFNGVFTNITEKELIKSLLILSQKVDFICTDLELITKNPDYYNEIYTSSKRLYTYAPLQEITLYNYKYSDTPEKTIPYYFGGTERGRTADFFEYIIRPNCEWYGKSPSLGLIKYLPYDEHIEKLKTAKTTILIADEKFNDIGFITHRYYESAKYQVICFADYKFDPDEIMIPLDDWRRVSSYKELIEKQKYLDENPEFYQNLITKQNLELFSKIHGRNIYDSIMKND